MSNVNIVDGYRFTNKFYYLVTNMFKILVALLLSNVTFNYWRSTNKEPNFHWHLPKKGIHSPNPRAGI